MLTGILAVNVSRRRIDDWPTVIGRIFRSDIHQLRNVAKWRVDLSLDTRRLVTPGRQSPIHANADRDGNRAEHDRQPKMVGYYSHALRSIEEGAKAGGNLARKVGHPDRAYRSSFHQLSRAKDWRIAGRYHLDRAGA